MGEISVAILGGDTRRAPRVKDATVNVRLYGSQRDAGNGEQRALITAVKGGSFKLVIVLVRWLGHAQFHEIVKVCKDVGVRCITVKGGLSAAAKAIDTFVEAS